MRYRSYLSSKDSDDVWILEKTILGMKLYAGVMKGGIAYIQSGSPPRLHQDQPETVEGDTIAGEGAWILPRNPEMNALVGILAKVMNENAQLEGFIDRLLRDRTP